MQAFPVKCTILNCNGQCANSISVNRQRYCSNYNYWNRAVNKLGQCDLHLYWHDSNVDNPLLLAPTSIKEYIFCCPTCTHIWQMSVAKYTRGSRCPKCKMTSSKGTIQKSKRFATSKAEKATIAKYEIILGEKAISMLHNEQFQIKGVGKVDGYFPKANTVVEYHGCYWHGCPRCYPNRKLKHPKLKKTYEQLYNKTCTRDAKIRSLGFNLITIWSCENYWD